jgi:two-component system chemotaxis response regulator CheY
MKKILIVDDNKNNRLTLQFILEDFEEDQEDVSLELFYAQDGIEAVQMCKDDKFDIIFMDIMMPNMDGIEATSVIRAQDSNALIIACSALSDNEHKNAILSAGAEDYLTKPINSDLFIKRMSNYLRLIESRKKVSYNVNAENILENNVYFRKTVFSVSSESALGEFWEYFLLDGNFPDSEDFSDFIRFLYALGIYQVKHKFQFSIFLEENDSSFFFTMDNIILLKQEIIEKLISKNYPQAIYKIWGNKISFQFLKQSESNIITHEDEEDNNEIQSISKEQLSKVEVPKEENIVLQTYDFMDSEDIAELESITSELQSLIVLLGGSRMGESDIMLLSGYIRRFSKILTMYNETYAISNSLKVLADDIENNIESFQEKAQDIGILCESFNRDLRLWVEKLFFEGAPSIDFLDSSILSNATMISSFIKESEEEEVEVLDDIFDF